MAPCFWIEYHSHERGWQSYLFLVDKNKKRKFKGEKTAPMAVSNAEVSPPKCPESPKMTPIASDQLFSL